MSCSSDALCGSEDGDYSASRNGMWLIRVLYPLGAYLCLRDVLTLWLMVGDLAGCLLCS